MAEERKARSDFSNDSEWYTYKITHPDEFREDKQEDEDEKIKPAVYQCRLCGYIIDETIPPFVKLEDYNKKCPGCGCKIDAKNYRLVKPEHLKKALEYRKNKEINKKQKEKEEKKFLMLKASALKKKIKTELKDIYEDLKKDLENGEIDAKDFVRLLINLYYNVIKYNKNNVLDISWSDFRDLTYKMADNVVENYNLKQSVEEILEDYEKEKDDKYLEYSLVIANNAMSSQEGIDEKEQLEKDIQILESQIEFRKKINEDYERTVDKEQERLEDIYGNDLRKSLKALNIKKTKSKK